MMVVVPWVSYECDMSYNPIVDLSQQIIVKWGFHHTHTHIYIYMYIYIYGKLWNNYEKPAFFKHENDGNGSGAISISGHSSGALESQIPGVSGELRALDHGKEKHVGHIEIPVHIYIYIYIYICVCVW